MHKPFAVLADLVRDGRITFGKGRQASNPDHPASLRSHPSSRGGECGQSALSLPQNLPDSELFDYAMKDVKALGWSAVPLHPRAPREIQPQNDEDEALRVLEEFLRSGDATAELMGEYIEGATHPSGKLYLHDLRSGRFSVQAHLDLHGMNQQEARFALDEFILASTRSKFGCVRVIHGRGRHSSKEQPVLKESVQRWLCSRRIGRHVLAFTSARRCDGGGGAVYILLRR
jgi:DNA-nicking Smr family endonuclease